jgi:DNA-binding HxlR family transcriptional regulator
MMQSAFLGSDDLGGFEISLIDEVVHGRLRLGVLALLSREGAADFMWLKAQLNASDGNLSTHLRTLEQAGYVWVEKRFADRKPLTRVVLSEAGRQAFLFYVEAMARLVADHARDAAWT